MTLTDADLDYLERNAREMTPGPRGCEAGEPVPGERFYVTGPTPGIPDDLQDGVFGEVLMSAEHHGDAVVAAFLTQARILALVAMARRAPRWIPSDELLPDEGVRVLAWPDQDYGEPCFGRRTRFEGALTWTADDGRWIVPDPAFWMPLPAPPEEKP